MAILKEEIIELRKSLDYSNKEVEFFKFEVEKMGHQIDQLTFVNKDLSIQMNNLREYVNNRLVRLEVKIQKPDNEEEEQKHCEKPEVVPDVEETQDNIPLAKRLPVVPLERNNQVELNEDNIIHSKKTPNSMIKKIKMKAIRPTMKAASASDLQKSNTK